LSAEGTADAISGSSSQLRRWCGCLCICGGRCVGIGVCLRVTALALNLTQCPLKLSLKLCISVEFPTRWQPTPRLLLNFRNVISDALATRKFIELVLTNSLTITVAIALDLFGALELLLFVWQITPRFTPLSEPSWTTVWQDITQVNITASNRTGSGATVPSINNRISDIRRVDIYINTARATNGTTGTTGSCEATGSPTDCATEDAGCCLAGILLGCLSSAGTFGTYITSQWR
jgi:hypothetical protein